MTAVRERGRAVLGLVVAMCLVVLSGSTFAGAHTEGNGKAHALGSQQLQSGDEVARIYLVVLGREGDPGGLDHWIGVRNRGASLSRITDLFLTSAEFAQKGDLDDIQFVSLLYRNAFLREIDDAGLAFQLGELGDGATRTSVALSFIQSEELIQRLTPTQPPVATVPEPGGPPSPLLMIGDSIFHGLKLREIGIGASEITWKTKEGRQADTLPGLLDEAAADGSLTTAEAVVIHLGTNGWKPSWEDMFNAQLVEMADKNVYVVNVKAARAWEWDANQALARVAEAHPHVTLVDWNAEASPKAGWIRSDQVHPTLSGLQGLGALLTRELTTP